MKIFDAHVHLYPEAVLEKEEAISKEPVNDLLSLLSGKLIKKGIREAVVYLLDANILSMELKPFDNIILASVINYSNYARDLEKASAKGIKIIKILPYDQKVTKEMYPKIIEIAKMIKDKNMVLSICSTYGSKLVYETNGVELAAKIKHEVDLPIILAHGGGPKVFDAMTMALEYEDIFLDLSFSLKYWWGSSVIQDFAFAIKKLGGKKCFYGSDYPYVDFDESKDYFLRLMKEYNFSKEEQDNMLYANFEEFKRIYL